MNNNREWYSVRASIENSIIRLIHNTVNDSTLCWSADALCGDTISSLNLGEVEYLMWTSICKLNDKVNNRTSLK